MATIDKEIPTHCSYKNVNVTITHRIVELSASPGNKVNGKFSGWGCSNKICGNRDCKACIPIGKTKFWS